ncbi:transcription factor bHLH128-like isoform X2 [Tasmannia lanceolata]|uniref:transcription factor bHLH128-like isoform X2 n=1 Tax=Tasmannia lanceolata TaxID=3420 RepID=UPI004064A760
MYTSQRPMGSGLSRYGSAPSSLIKSLVDSIVSEEEFSAVGSENMMGRFFSADSSSLTAESSCKTANMSPDLEGVKTGLERSYGLNQISVGDFPTASNFKSGPSPLIRHSSSPAGFLSNLMIDNGFSAARGIENNLSSHDGGHGIAGRGRLKSQLSFSGQDSHSQLYDIGESVAGCNAPDDTAGQSYMSGSFQMGSWDDTNSIVFSPPPPSKRAKDINGDIVSTIHNLDSQFSLPTTSMEMATVEKLFQMQQNSVPCKIRARRGCATHPRSIAERDRRTRISEKLRKIEELVPNTDKQTNTAEMLDLAVQHIKFLQNQVQTLKQDLVNCKCESKHAVERF